MPTDRLVLEFSFQGLDVLVAYLWGVAKLRRPIQDQANVAIREVAATISVIAAHRCSRLKQARVVLVIQNWNQVFDGILSKVEQSLRSIVVVGFARRKPAPVMERLAVLQRGNEDHCLVVGWQIFVGVCVVLQGAG